MKFSLLAVGQQFEYQGETYIKSTPLIAHHVDSGEQKLIPRSASVTVASTAGIISADSKKETVRVEDLQQAFARFEEELQKEVESDARLSRAFSEAKQNFFQRLAIKPRS